MTEFRFLCLVSGLWCFSKATDSAAWAPWQLSQDRDMIRLFAKNKGIVRSSSVADIVNLCKKEASNELVNNFILDVHLE